MKNLFFHIKYILLIALLAFSSIAMGQNIVTKDKGDSTFTAATSASSVAWFIDGVNVVGQTGLSFTKGLNAGMYTISAIPSKGGCIGNTFNTTFIIKDDVTKGDKQIVITRDTIQVCPQSDVPTDSSVAIVEIEFRDYLFPYSADNFVIMQDQLYVVGYKIDNGDIHYVDKDKSITSLVIDTKLLLSGSFHELKIMRLAYSSIGNGVIDRTVKYSEENSPSVILKVRPMLEIEDINVIEE